MAKNAKVHPRPPTDTAAPLQESQKTKIALPRSLADLVPAPYNPRKISPAAISGLKHSISTFGDLSGIVWNSRSGCLVAGHQRLASLRALHGDKLRFEGGAVVTPGGDRFPVRVVDFTMAQERAANVAANNPMIAGEFDDGIEALLESIKADDAEMFERLRLDALADSLFPNAAEPGECDPDETPPAPVTPITKPGDLWLLGEHRLLCGDSTKADDVARVMAGERAVLMNTDPPYGIDYAAIKNGIPGSGFKDIQARGGDITNDDLTDGAALQDFLERMIRAAIPSLIENPAFYLWHPMLTQGTFFAAAAAADILIHRQIIWVKPNMVLTRSGMYHWKHELCFYGWIRGNPCAWLGNKSQVSVWELGESQSGRNHPTQKPVALFDAPILNHTRKGDIVYEPFAGSGSQFIAAHQLSRKCYGLEIEPKYCDVIVSRWEKFTGGKAKLA